MNFFSHSFCHIIGVLLCLSSGLYAAIPEADLLHGINREKAGNMEQAAELYKAAALAGNAWAQYNFGVLLYTGNGVSENKKRAVKYWKAAASRGNIHARFNIALCYARGEGGLQQDYAKAVKLWHQTAEAGISQSWVNLAICAAKGLGMEQDREKAREFLAKVHPELELPPHAAAEQAEQLTANAADAETTETPGLDSADSSADIQEDTALSEEEQDEDALLSST